MYNAYVGDCPQADHGGCLLLAAIRRGDEKLGERLGDATEQHTDCGSR